MNETNLKCSCGANLYRYYSRTKSKGSNAPYDLMCWECGKLHKRNGQVRLITPEGTEIRAGRHNLFVRA